MPAASGAPAGGAASGPAAGTALLLAVALLAGCVRGGAVVTDLAAPTPRDGAAGDAPDPPCGDGGLACNGACVDPLVDATHCGRCGHECGAGIGCLEGACAQVACPGSLGLPGPPMTPGVGRQIALGDINSDGSLDLVGADTQVLRIALSRGGGTFGPVTSYATDNAFRNYGPNPDLYGGPNLALGDFDGNGALDVAQVGDGAALADSPDIDVLLNLGGGLLGLPRLLVIDDPTFVPLGVVALDFDGDHRLDLAAVGTYFLGPYYLWALRGAGDGSFRPVPIPGPPSISQTLSLCTGDLDGDGLPDLAAAARGSASVLVSYSRGDGTFTPAVEVPVPLRPERVAIADIDGDGAADLVLASAGAVAVVSNLGARTFVAPGQVSVIPAGNGVVSLSVVDMDGDGHLDVVTAEADPLRVDGMGVTLLHNGGGTITAAVRYPGGANVRHHATGDLDGDGHPDVAVALGTGDVAVLLNDGTGTLSTQRYFDGGAVPAYLAAGDLDGDGAIDLVTASRDDAQAIVRWNDGQGGFRAFDVLPVGRQPQSLTVADVDGDGRADLLVPGRPDGVVTVLLSAGARRFKDPLSVSAGDLPRWVGVVDIDGDGSRDLVVQNERQRGLTLIANRGPVRFAPPTTLPLAFEPRQVAIGDVDGDTRPDLVVVDSASTFMVLPGRGKDGFGYGPRFSAGSNLLGSFLALADVDGDGALDVTVGNTAAGGVTVAWNDGHGRFDRLLEVPTPAPPQHLSVGDVNGDGRPDLVGTSLTGNVMALLGAGRAPLSRAYQYPAGLSPVAVVAAELDGDGRQDVAVVSALGAPGAGLSVLFSRCLR